MTLSTATSGATITYTLNGAYPTLTSAVVPNGGTLVMGNFTLMAKAWRTGTTPSAAVAASYQVTGSLVTARVAGGDGHTLAVRGGATVISVPGVLHQKVSHFVATTTGSTARSG